LPLGRNLTAAVENAVGVERTFLSSFNAN